MGVVCLWEVSGYRRCPIMGGVRLWEVSTYGEQARGHASLGKLSNLDSLKPLCLRVTLWQIDVLKNS